MDGRLALPSFNAKRLADPRCANRCVTFVSFHCRNSTACTRHHANAHHRDHCQGVTHSAHVDLPLGHPASSSIRSPDRREIPTTGLRRLGGTRLNRLIESVWNLEQVKDIGTLMPPSRSQHDNRAIDRHQGQRLRELLATGTIAIPGAFNALTAIQIERAGFDALYVSGAAISAARGPPDIGLISLTDMAGTQPSSPTR